MSKQIIKKFIACLLILIAVMFIIPTGSSFALEEMNNNIQPMAGPTTYKKDVKYYKSWGSWTRVSMNVRVAKGQSASINATQTKSFSRTISGDVSGLSISKNKTISSSIGHTLTTSQPGTWYLAFRPRYNVESGTRVHMYGVGTSYTKNRYTVKVPYTGEYKLIKVK